MDSYCQQERSKGRDELVSWILTVSSGLPLQENSNPEVISILKETVSLDTVIFQRNAFLGTAKKPHICEEAAVHSRGKSTLTHGLK